MLVVPHSHHNSHSNKHILSVLLYTYDLSFANLFLNTKLLWVRPGTNERTLGVAAAGLLQAMREPWGLAPMREPLGVTAAGLLQAMRELWGLALMREPLGVAAAGLLQATREPWGLAPTREPLGVAAAGLLQVCHFCS